MTFSPHLPKIAEPPITHPNQLNAFWNTSHVTLTLNPWPSNFIRSWPPDYKKYLCEVRSTSVHWFSS